MGNNLERFINAQENDYDNALTEIVQGRKRSHWMWYIFPQVQSLGFSETSKFYAIKNLDEAMDYLKHPILGERLIRICNALIKNPGNDAHKIFGSPDDTKLKSSMTLFAELPGTDPVFQSVLDKFFNGTKDNKTIEILISQQG